MLPERRAPILVQGPHEALSVDAHLNWRAVGSFPVTRARERFLRFRGRPIELAGRWARRLQQVAGVEERTMVLERRELLGSVGLGHLQSGPFLGQLLQQIPK
jgi:hypothetical protein